jgi:hypothetical protein
MLVGSWKRAGTKRWPVDAGLDDQLQHPPVSTRSKVPDLRLFPSRISCPASTAYHRRWTSRSHYQFPGVKSLHGQPTTSPDHWPFDSGMYLCCKSPRRCGWPSVGRITRQRGAECSHQCLFLAVLLDADPPSEIQEKTFVQPEGSSSFTPTLTIFSLARRSGERFVQTTPHPWISKPGQPFKRGPRSELGPLERPRT